MTDPKQLDDYQDTGARHLAGGGLIGRAALCDDPGLGKTAQAIRAMDLLNQRRALVICPAAVKDVWVDEFERWGYLGRRVVPVTQDTQLGAWLDLKIDVAVVSYEYATSRKKYFMDDLIPAIIIDEAHYLKNKNASRTRKILGGDADGRGGLIEMSGNTMWLTGTPMMNQPLDIWTLLRSHGATRLSVTDFERQFFQLVWEKNKPVLKVAEGRIDELRDMVASVVLRRSKSLLNLPPMRAASLNIRGDQSEILALLKEFPGLDAAIMDAVDQGSLSFLDAQHIGTLRRLTAEAKAPGFAEYLVESFKGGLDCCVVIGVHTKALRIIQATLEKAGLRVGVISGQPANNYERDRGQMVKDFQAGKLDVILGNIIAAGVGVTLTRANTIFMFETDWVAMQNVQALARIDRKGQLRRTLAYFVSLSNSVDQRVTEKVKQKVEQILRVDPTALDAAIFADQ